MERTWTLAEQRPIVEADLVAVRSLTADVSAKADQSALTSGLALKADSSTVTALTATVGTINSNYASKVALSTLEYDMYDIQTQAENAQLAADAAQATANTALATANAVAPVFHRHIYSGTGVQPTQWATANRAYGTSALFYVAGEWRNPSETNSIMLSVNANVKCSGTATTPVLWISSSHGYYEFGSTGAVNGHVSIACSFMLQPQEKFEINALNFGSGGIVYGVGDWQGYYQTCTLSITELWTGVDPTLAP